ncbi:MAG TPA: M28 family metallopeptidase [Bryocella sp.]|nr:M28 family metallopeptidase [Bryocella sp.]
MKRSLALGAAAACLLLLTAGAPLGRSQAPTTDLLSPPAADPAITAALRTISPDAIRADIAKLVSFGTRNTLSSMDTGLPPGQGINASSEWIESQFRAISANCRGCLEVKRDSFIQQPTSFNGQPSRFAGPTRLVNVYAILHGTSTDKNAPWTLVTGHYDSRATNVMDSHITAPGANDDASGVAVSLESARALSKLKLTGTIVFATVAGEEQGLNGSHHLAELARSEGWPLVAALNNDIVGGDTTPGETQQRKDVVRVFSESVPATATPEQQRQILSLGAENDSPSRELARSIAELAPAYFQPAARHAKRQQASGFHPVLILRRDRYLRGGDHTSFNNAGFAAVRFTEWRENFNHQHQTLRTENGIEYGDLLKFVDPDYVAQVARLNSATLATLAAAPSEPRNVRVLTHNLGNNTELAWEPSAFAPPGTTYEVVWRDTTDELWTHARNTGAETHITLDVSKDNVLFGVRAVDTAGHRSLPVSPVPARQ